MVPPARALRTWSTGLWGSSFQGDGNRPVVVALAVLIAGIVVTSALDLRDLRHKPDEGLDERVEL